MGSAAGVGEAMGVIVAVTVKTGVFRDGVGGAFGVGVKVVSTRRQPAYSAL